MTKLPCFYYSTTAVIIDDDQIFLENIVTNLSNRISYQLFDNPKDAFIFLHDQEHYAPHPQEFLCSFIDSSDDSVQYGKHPLNVNFAAIRNKLYNKNRFSIPSVIVVDHDMPDINGVEFCRNFIDFPIKKIMLTGVADHKIAINAFNDGIIDKFIMKDDPNIFQTLNKAIYEMQHEYFIGLSELIISNITASTFSYLSHKKFIKFFFEFIKNQAITEFYLIDPIGSFLLVNASYEFIWFIVKSEQTILNDKQIAIDQGASNEILSAFTTKTKLLFLFSEEDYKQSVEMWPSHLYPANKVDDIQGCYYAVIHEKNVCKIKNKYIVKQNVPQLSNHVG